MARSRQNGRSTTRICHLAPSAAVMAGWSKKLKCRKVSRVDSKTTVTRRRTGRETRRCSGAPVRSLAIRMWARVRIPPTRTGRRPGSSVSHDLDGNGYGAMTSRQEIETRRPGRVQAGVNLHSSIGGLRCGSGEGRSGWHNRLRRRDQTLWEVIRAWNRQWNGPRASWERVRPRNGRDETGEVPARGLASVPTRWLRPLASE
jgi:hypothetical protein